MQVKEDKLFNYFYKITNLINGKFYYGIRSSNKLHSDKYMGSGLALLEAFKKYGRENFKKEIINHYPTRFEASEHERMIVDLEMINNPMCYNCRTGGQNGYIRNISIEEREKISIANKGRILSPETKQKQSESRKLLLKNRPDLRNRLGENSVGGKLITEELRSKMRENRKNQVITPESRIKAIDTRKNNGKEWHSEESKQKMSEKNWLRKLKGTPEMSKKMSDMADKRPCIIEGVYFESVAAVNRFFKITSAARRLESKTDKFKEWNYVEKRLED